MTDPDAPSPERDLTIADLTILVVGCAVAITWLRALNGIDGFEFSLTSAEWRRVWWTWTVIPLPVLTALGMATLACRFQAPRPPVAQLMNRPGTTAMTAFAVFLFGQVLIVCLGAALEPLIDLISSRPFSSPSGYYPPRLATFTTTIFHAGSLVAITWIIQALSGRWEPERSWFDRVGRVVGFGLIALDLIRALGLAARI